MPILFHYWPGRWYIYFFDLAKIVSVSYTKLKCVKKHAVYCRGILIPMMVSQGISILNIGFHTSSVKNPFNAPFSLYFCSSSAYFFSPAKKGLTPSLIFCFFPPNLHNVVTTTKTTLTRQTHLFGW